MTDNQAECLKSIIQSGNVKRLRKMIKRDPSCANKTCQGGKAPLHLVYNHINKKQVIQADDRLPIIQALLENGAYINALAWYSNGMRPVTPLILAVEKHQVNGVKLLLKMGASIYVNYNNRSYTALHSAVSKYAIDDQIIKLLLEYGVDPNAIDEDYNHTPLTKAVSENRLDIVRLLVEDGAQVNKVLKYGECALLWACKNVNLEIFEYLISHGAKIDLKNQYLLLHTPLHAIADSRDNFSPENNKNLEYIIRSLIQQGVDVNAKNFENNTALHIATKKEDEYMIYLLLNAGAYKSINIQNVDKETPLHILLSKDNYWTDDSLALKSIARLFIILGANLTIKNINGLTPLNMAVNNTHRDVVDIMMAKIAGVPEILFKSNENIREWCYVFGKDRQLMNELNIAAILGYDCVVDRLIDKGYLTKLSNEICGNSGKPALICALETNQYQIGKLLLEAGCRVNRNFRWNTPIHLVGIYFRRTLKLYCLFWDYIDISIQRKSLKYYFEDIKNQDLSDWGELFQLLVLFFAISIRMDKKDETLISTKKIFSSNKDLMTTLFKCNICLDQFKKVKVYGNYNKFDILCMNIKSLVNLLYDTKIFNAFTIFHDSIKKSNHIECADYLLMRHINLAIKKKKLLDRAKYFLDETFQFILSTINYNNLPDHIMYEILSYFTMRDLKKITGKLKKQYKSVIKFGVKLYTDE